MNQEILLKVLLAPHITEKTAFLESHGEYVFKVSSCANKRQIKQAVEWLFKVTVDRVRTVRVKGERRMRRRVLSTTKTWKKAYVQLKQGQVIRSLTDIDSGVL